MDDFLEELMAGPLAGIPLTERRGFFSQFTGE